MKSFEELVDQVTDKISSPTEKELCNKALKMWINEGKFPSAETIGVSQEVMNHFYAYGYRLYHAGDYKKAAVIFTWLSLLNENNFNYMFALASCYHMLKQYQEALNTYLVACEIDLNNPMPCFHAADCYIKMNKPEVAIYCLEFSIAQAADKPKYAKLKERATLMLLHLAKEGEVKKA